MKQIIKNFLMWLGRALVEERHCEACNKLTPHQDGECLDCDFIERAW